MESTRITQIRYETNPRANGGGNRGKWSWITDYLFNFENFPKMDPLNTNVSYRCCSMVRNLSLVKQELLILPSP